MSGSSYLSTVNPDLQGLGIEADALYYHPEDIQMGSIEFNNRIGRYSRSLTSLQFGSTSDISIPNYDFCGSTYLQVELPALPTTVSLPQGALFHMIESINYSWGTSNISLVKISGVDMLHHNYVACETKEKRDAMLSAAGNLLTKTDTRPASKMAICLKFPWSVMSCDQRKKLFDTRILNTNMLIQITFNSKDKFFGYEEADKATVPDGFASAEIILKQNELTNHADSLYSLMRKQPNKIYNYPFIHLQTGTTFRFQSTGTTPVHVRFELNSFLNSDLIGILFSVVRAKDISRQGDAYPFINPFDCQQVCDVKLEYNGQILSSYPGKLLDLATLNISKGDTTANLHKLDVETGAVDGDSVLSYVHYLPFTQYKNITFGENYTNNSVFKSQPLDLEFSYLPAIKVVDPVVTTETMVVRTTYLYNAYASIEDFTSSIHFG
jgi:hypothetical protein